jgi:hypothetical protein
MKILLTFSLLIIFSLNIMAQDSKDTPFEWNLDFGYETGEYKIPANDEGNYKSIYLGTRLGFNFSRVFVGAVGRFAPSSFSSSRPSNSVNRLNNPLPDGSSTLWGPTIAYKFNYVHFYYSLLFESHKFAGDVTQAGTQSNLVYRYEGTGHEAGVGFRLYGNIFLTYSFRTSEMGDFKTKVDGNYTPEEAREHPLRVNTHVIGLRIPISLHKLPGMIQSSLSSN